MEKIKKFTLNFKKIKNYVIEYISSDPELQKWNHMSIESINIKNDKLVLNIVLEDTYYQNTDNFLVSLNLDKMEVLL